MKVKPFEEASQRLQQLFQTRYNDPLANASAYLRAISGTTVPDQHRLFALIIQRHYVTMPVQTDETPTKIPKEYFVSVSESLLEKALAWISESLSANRPSEETARILWDSICLCDGQDRTIALSFVINPRHGLVPYAQLPEPPIIRPADYYVGLHNDPKQLERIARMFRIFHASLNSIQKATLLEQLLVENEQGSGNIVLLKLLTEWATQRSTPHVYMLIPDLTGGEPEEEKP